LKPPKQRFIHPPDSWVGFNSTEHSAGLSESAGQAEIITEMPIVTANCWYGRPVIPGINAVGTNTAARINANRRKLSDRQALRDDVAGDHDKNRNNDSE
jgi:hypothetical protein